jgi:AraC-like DNA-binding protein
MEITSVIIKIIIYAGIVQGFYSAFLLSHTRLRNPANHYLALLLAVLGFSILHSTFIIPYFHHFHNTSFQIREPFILLVVPLIWLYVKKLNDPKFKFIKKHLFHFIPFLVIMFFSAFFMLHHANISNNSRFDNHTFILNSTLYVIALVQYLFYLIFMLRLIRNFKAKALNELSNTENIDPAWLRIFLFTFLSVFLLLIVMMVIAIHRLNFNYFNSIVSLVFALIIYILGYKGLFQKAILPEHIEIIDNVQTDKINNDVKIDEKLLEKLINFMVNEKPYFDPELSLTSLAGLVKINRNQLSELINSGTGGNFYDFVNKYRVDEVKLLMDSPKYKDYTLLAIAFEAGFPSKSTFNSIFKKFTGLTPSEYKSGLQ